MAKIALTSNSWQNSFQGISSRTRGEILDDSGDDADGEKWLIIFWEGSQDWSSG
jgi:hypothetical protein